LIGVEHLATADAVPLEAVSECRVLLLQKLNPSFKRAEEIGTAGAISPGVLP
jgi:hypothetical protein